MYYRSLFALSVISFLAVPAAQCRVQDSDGAGLSISKTATSQDVGLPLYPGARPYKEESDSSSSVRLGAWGGGSGFKLAVLKLQSTASPDKIKDFYRTALSKYGPVLDCKNAGGSSGKQKDGKALSCEDGKPEAGETLLKAGNNDDQHEVAIKKEGDRTVVALLHIQGKMN